jgi:hypothetical protein
MQVWHNQADSPIITSNINQTGLQQTYAGSNILESSRPTVCFLLSKECAIMSSLRAHVGFSRKRHLGLSVAIR